MPSALWLLLLIPPAYVLLAWFVPAVIRPLFLVIAHGPYRFRVYHAGRIPAAGPALLVCNHVTYLDWLLLWAASPRPLTFVVWSGFDRNPVLRFGLSFARHRLVRIDKTGPKGSRSALDSATAALDAGRVVVVFAEGTLTRTGLMLPFGRGIERIARRAAGPVPIIPAFLDNLWGTQLSWERGRILKKWPQGPFRRRVALYIGEPLPGGSSAAEVKQAVKECDARCGIAQSDYLRPAPQQFVHTCSHWRRMWRTAFVDLATGSERTLTYGKALVAVWSLADWLRPRLGDNPRVGLWLPTGLGSTLANLAITFLGKATVNLNYTAGGSPVKSAAAQAGLTHVLTSKRFLDRVPLDLPGVEVVLLEDALAGLSPRGKLVRFLAVLLLPGWLLCRIIGLRSKLDDVLTVLFSSGSTGEPKGVMLSHRNVASNVWTFARAVTLVPGTDIMLSTLPVFHVFGHTVNMWAPALIGMKAVFHPDPRQGKEIGELCRRYRCTIMVGTATFLRIYLRKCQPDDFRTLRLMPCGAEKLPIGVAEEFRKRFGHLPVEGYGTTELSPVVGCNLVDVEVGGVKQIANTPGTIGQPFPGIAAKAFDPDTLAPLPVGTEGMLGALGPNVMLGYLHQPEKTAAVVRDGWYLTGDIGLIEETGFVRITGRLSRFAKIAGEMIPLERLDDELHDLLHADGERLLAVAAVPCERRGERVVVLYRPGVRERLPAAFDELRKRGLPNLWVPDLRDCYEVAEFPVLGSGKLDLRGLVELAKEVTCPVSPKR